LNHNAGFAFRRFHGVSEDGDSRSFPATDLAATVEWK
jgi:hypothetical protein